MATSQYITCGGHAIMEPNIRYHRIWLGNDPDTVYLLTFDEHLRSTRPTCEPLIAMTRKAFEADLLAGTIVEATEPVYLPVWLKKLHDVDINRLDQKRRYRVRSHLDLVDKRYAAIEPILADLGTLPEAEDAVKELNRRIRERCRNFHATRVRRWLFLYLAFEKEKASLLPRYFHKSIRALSGDEVTSVVRADFKKIGRRRRNGTTGHPCTQEMVTKLQEGYLKRMSTSCTWAKIYAEVLTKEFNCRSTSPSQQLQIYQPNGEPFPSLGQFKYHVRKKFPLSEIYELRYGVQRTRNREQVSKGRYSEHCAYLMQECQTDAYFIKERPVCLLDRRQPASPLVVVTILDLTSGAIVGVGFGQGSETSDAYKQALAVAAMNKREFASYMGLRIEEDDWPFIGIPQGLTADNGPGSSAAVRTSLEDLIFLFGTTPAHTPQSNGTAESSHPRKFKKLGEPEYTQSPMDVIEMVKAVILNIIAHNASADASARLTPEMTAEGVAATPLEIWKYLCRRGRINAQNVKRSTAIARYLRPVSVAIDHGEIYLGSLRYGSDDPALQKILARYRHQPKINDLQGYVFDVCVRTIWISIQDQLYALHPRFPIPVADRQQFISLEDLEKHNDYIRRQQSESQERKAGAAMWAQQQKDLQIGVKGRSTTKKGRAPTKKHGQQVERRIIKRSDQKKRPKP